MHIRGWLTGLIVFLLAPCLLFASLFASLWFHNKFENVSSIDRSLAGLNLVQSLGPLMQEKALTGQINQSTEMLRRRLVDFDTSEPPSELASELDSFLEEPNVPNALRQARSLTAKISRLAKLSSASSYETSRFPHLINDT